LEYVGRIRIARKSVVIGDEIKATMLGLQLQVLTHGAEKIAYMKFAGRLYARKNPQVNLPNLKFSFFQYKQYDPGEHNQIP